MNGAEVRHHECWSGSALTISALLAGYVLHLDGGAFALGLDPVKREGQLNQLMASLVKAKESRYPIKLPNCKLQQNV